MGLPVYRIAIKDKDLKQMENHIWSDRFFPATLSNGNGSPQAIRIRYRGGHTREYPKKSYEIRTSRATYHFNAEYDDPSLIRNALSFHFFNMIGVPSPSTQHCVLQLNGVNQGVYLRIEGGESNLFPRAQASRPKHHLCRQRQCHLRFEQRQHEYPENLAVFRIQADQRPRGRPSEADALHSEHPRQTGENAGKTFGNQRLYMDNFLTWLSGAVLTGNYDGFRHNYTIFEYRKRKAYGFLPWDYEGTWGRNCYGKEVASNLVSIKGHNKLTGKVLAYSANRQRYKEILEETSPPPLPRIN
ncbi:CotH kinase family protein [Paenibacillus sp. JTLBN-2024]